jgi:hypothetical protein
MHAALLYNSFTPPQRSESEKPINLSSAAAMFFFSFQKPHIISENEVTTGLTEPANAFEAYIV